MNARHLCQFGVVLITAMTAFGQAKSGRFEGVWQAVQVSLGGPQALTVKPGANLTIFAESITAESRCTQTNLAPSWQIPLAPQPKNCGRPGVRSWLRAEHTNSRTTRSRCIQSLQKILPP
jgi:hypothetical protein